IKKHLEPLAHASCIMQEAHACLDQVPLIFGTLMYEYLKMAETDGDHDGLIQAIIDSIEKRWAKCDQEAFILAIVLHPSLKTAPFAKNMPQLVPASLWQILHHLWTRFYSEDIPTNLFKEFMDYLHSRGVYSVLTGYIDSLQEVSSDPLHMYDGVYLESPLQRITWQLLSICSNSASCEHLFSMFGITLTHLRSRLSTNVMVNLAELQMHLHGLHMKQGLVKEYLKW
ncbi:hypothetical protein BDQ17DRAFT_1169802, partial [Cyathus striatus]